MPLVLQAKQRRKRQQEELHQRVSASRKALSRGASTPRMGKPGSGHGGPGKMNGHGLNGQANGHTNGHAPSPRGSFEQKAGTDGLAPRSSGDSFASVDSNDSFRSAWSRLQSSFGERLSPEGPLTAPACPAACVLPVIEILTLPLLLFLYMLLPYRLSGRHLL